MNDFFVWLFNEYVVPQVEEDSFPHEYQVEKRRWMEAIERMSQDDRLQSLDIMGHVQRELGARAFAMGIHLGIVFAEDFREIEDDPYEFPRRFSSDVLRDCGPMRTSAPTEMT